MVGVGEERKTNPRPSQCALPFYRRRHARIAGMHIRIHDVYSVLVLKRGIGAFPGRDAAAAVPQHHRIALHPRGAEAVEEVGLARDLAVFEVGVAELADVDLGRLEWVGEERRGEGREGLTVSW